MVKQKGHTAKVTCHVLTHFLSREICSNMAYIKKRKRILASQTEGGSFGGYGYEILKILYVLWEA